MLNRMKEPVRFRGPRAVERLVEDLGEETSRLRRHAVMIRYS